MLLKKPESKVGSPSALGYFCAQSADIYMFGVKDIYVLAETYICPAKRVSTEILTRYEPFAPNVRTFSSKGSNLRKTKSRLFSSKESALLTKTVDCLRFLGKTEFSNVSTLSFLSARRISHGGLSFCPKPLIPGKAEYRYFRGKVPILLPKTTDTPRSPRQGGFYRLVNRFGQNG